MANIQAPRWFHDGRIPLPPIPQFLTSPICSWVVIRLISWLLKSQDNRSGCTSPKSSFQSCHFVHNSPAVLGKGKPKNPKWRPDPGEPPCPAKKGSLTPGCAQCHIPHGRAAIVSPLPAARKWSWQVGTHFFETRKCPGRGVIPKCQGEIWGIITAVHPRAPGGAPDGKRGDACVVLSPPSPPRGVGQPRGAGQEHGAPMAQ